jgi:hypothetical protein
MTTYEKIPNTPRVRKPRQFWQLCKALQEGPAHVELILDRMKNKGYRYYPTAQGAGNYLSRNPQIFEKEGTVKIRRTSGSNYYATVWKLKDSVKDALDRKI